MDRQQFEDTALPEDHAVEHFKMQMRKKFELTYSPLHQDASGKVWSIDGSDPSLPQMTKSHLENTIKMIKRTAQACAKKNESLYKEACEVLSLHIYENALNQYL